MKSQINFDTLEYMQELKNSGLTEQQAQGLTKATAKAFGQMADVKELVTKNDIIELKNATQKDILTLELALKSFIVKSFLIGIGALGTIQSLIQHYIK